MNSEKSVAVAKICKKFKVSASRFLPAVKYPQNLDDKIPQKWPQIKPLSLIQPHMKFSFKPLNECDICK